MERPLKGDVVVIPFPFSDLSQSKRRPALVVATLPGEDLILCQITSRDRGDTDAIALHEADFISGGLNRPSFACPARLFTANRSLVLYKPGTLRPESMRAVTDKIIEILTR